MCPRCSFCGWINESLFLQMPYPGLWWLWTCHGEVSIPPQVTRVHMYYSPDHFFSTILIIPSLATTQSQGSQLLFTSENLDIVICPPPALFTTVKLNDPTFLFSARPAARTPTGTRRGASRAASAWTRPASSSTGGSSKPPCLPQSSHTQHLQVKNPALLQYCQKQFISDIMVVIDYRTSHHKSALVCWQKSSTQNTKE